MQVSEIHIFVGLLSHKHDEGISDSCCRVDDYEDGAK